jgi:UDP-N-acetylglucosamine transferase subunit ALG13
MSRVFVTVGMAPQPFDRLILAVRGIVGKHDVFAQVGTSSIDPGCPHARYIAYWEVLDLIEAADVVVTHAGNTVRLVQRIGKVPIAIPRQASRDEMSNDHQTDYLRQEEVSGRVVALWNEADLRLAVERHPEVERSLLAERPPPNTPDPTRIRETMNALANRLVMNTNSRLIRFPT